MYCETCNLREKKLRQVKSTRRIGYKNLFLIYLSFLNEGFPVVQMVKKSVCNAGDLSSIPGLGSYLRREWHPTPIFLPGESHGQRSLETCSPWGRTQADMTGATEYVCTMAYHIYFRKVQFFQEGFSNGEFFYCPQWLLMFFSLLSKILLLYLYVHIKTFKQRKMLFYKTELIFYSQESTCNFLPRSIYS